MGGCQREAGKLVSWQDIEVVRWCGEVEVGGKGGKGECCKRWIGREVGW